MKALFKLTTLKVAALALGTLLTTAVANAQTFKISSTSASPTSIAAGQTVTLSFKVYSSAAATNVNAYVSVLHSGSPDVRLDLRNLNFSAGETKTLSVKYTAKITDRIGTKNWSVRVYDSKNQLKALAYTQRYVVIMEFRQSTGVGVFEPFGLEYDNFCDNESTRIYRPCSLGGSMTVMHPLSTANDYFADSYRAMPAGCVESATGAVCDGVSAREISRRWNGSSAVTSDITANTNIASAATMDGQLGDLKTPAIVSNSNVALDSAAHFCSNLDYGGFNDWHLPNKSELALLYCRSVAPKNTVYPQEMPGCTKVGAPSYGMGSEGTFYDGSPAGIKFNYNKSLGSTVYLSSSEADAGNVWAQDFATGEQIKVPKTNAGLIRCIRKPYGVK